jgi:hypothetical protein
MIKRRQLHVSAGRLTMFDIYGNTQKISCCEPLRDSRKESLSMDEGRILKQTARNCNYHVPKRSDVVGEKSRS